MFNFHHESHVDSSFVHASEDLDPNGNADLTALMDELRKASPRIEIDSIPNEDHARRLWDIFENTIGAGLGTAELIDKYPAVGPLLDRIRARRLFNYTYQVSPRLIRGSRPSVKKLQWLADAKGIKATINLCAEMKQGDMRLIRDADRDLTTKHVKIIDNTWPDDAEVASVLEFLEDPAHCPAYIHCEAGTGRTGIMTACYRLAVNRWDLSQTQAEGERFDFHTPDQRTFVEDFASAVEDSESIVAQALLRLGYPKSPTEASSDPPNSSVRRTDCEDTASLTS